MFPLMLKLLASKVLFFENRLPGPIVLQPDQQTISLMYLRVILSGFVFLSRYVNRIFDHLIFLDLSDCLNKNIILAG